MTSREQIDGVFRDCQRTRRWYVGMFVAILLALASALGKIAIDTAVTRQKVETIEAMMQLRKSPTPSAAAEAARLARIDTREGAKP